jgi:hypothetical protein
MSTGCDAREFLAEVAMRLVNHASELVHQIYQREKVEDLVNGGMWFSFRHVGAVSRAPQ